MTQDYEFEMRASRERDMTLSTHVAIAIINRSLRPLIKRANRFVATLVIEGDQSYATFRTAAFRVLEDLRGMEARKMSSIDVFGIANADDAKAFLGKLQHSDRVIMLVRPDAMIPSITIASDMVKHISRPSPADYKIAARRMGFGRLEDADADFIASQELGMVSLAFRKGRNFGAAIRQLRTVAQPDEVPVPERVDAQPTLADLTGYGEARTWGLELAEDLKDWKAGLIGWSDVDRGLLLSGPPGSGKTHYARALANSCTVPLVATSAAQWQSQGHLGDMLRAMRRSFDDARRQAPSILFIDEFDSIGDRSLTSGESASYQRQVVNALLECLDGVQSFEGVAVVAATNFPELIDPALLRPGRIERHIAIAAPDAKAREGIFRFHLGEDLKDTDVKEPVDQTDGWTGAEIAKCVRIARRSARRQRRALVLRDVLAAMPKKLMLSNEVLELAAIHEAGHAVVGVILNVDNLVGVSINESLTEGSHSQYLGGAVFEERLYTSKTSTYFENRIAMLLAGMAAETLIYGEHSTGAGGDAMSDLVRATELATMMEIKWGFGSSLASHAVNLSSDLERIRITRPRIYQDVDVRLRTQLDRATQLLAEQIDVLKNVSDALFRVRSLTGKQVREMIKKESDILENSLNPRALESGV